MSDAIKADVLRRGIARLCHFTPSRNLGQILSGNSGVLATSKLKEDERNIFAPTDLERLDGHTRHISCSIEYPNAWYFDKARSRELLFRDWAIVFIAPTYLWKKETLFCPRNAAASFGREVGSGERAFMRLFAPEVVGAYGRKYSRSSLTPDYCVTDEQAEVLIAEEIALEDILGFAVTSIEQARNEVVRLKFLGIPYARIQELRVIVSSDLFDKNRLSRLLKQGKRPQETLFDLSTLK
jgi:hypothetical protein